MPGRPESKRNDPISGQFVKGNVGGATQRLLTADRHKAIVGHVGDGNYLSTSARAAGVHARTLSKWLKRGEADHEAGRRSPFRALFLDVRRAAAVNEAKIVSVIKTAAVEGFKVQRVHKRTDEHGKVVKDIDITAIAPDWRAGARLLESRAMSRFGVKRQLEVGGRIAHMHIPVPPMTEEDEAIATRIATRRMADLAVDGHPPPGPDRLLPAGGDGDPD